jgi:hypothetical protein
VAESHEHGLHHRRLARELQPLAVRAALVRVEQRIPQTGRGCLQAMANVF